MWHILNISPGYGYVVRLSWALSQLSNCPSFINGVFSMCMVYMYKMVSLPCLCVKSGVEMKEEFRNPWFRLCWGGV